VVIVTVQGSDDCSVYEFFRLGVVALCAGLGCCLTYVEK